MKDYLNSIFVLDFREHYLRQNGRRQVSTSLLPQCKPGHLVALILGMNIVL